MNRQNELIRSLQQELEAKDRELAEQKWVFEQFLRSPAWRLTYPLRWLARQFRWLRQQIGKTGRAGTVDPISKVDASRRHMTQSEVGSAVAADSPDELKKAFTDIQRAALKSFHFSDAVLELPSSADPEVSIILVLFNRAELTLACMRSISENYRERLEVIVVDNASTDQTGVLLHRLRGARIIWNSENQNFLLGVNQAAKEARGKYLLLLNNDAQLLPGSLQAALKAIRSSPDIGAVGGRIVLVDGTLQEAGSIAWRDGSCLGYGRGDNPFAPMYMFRRDVDYCSGAFLLTPRAVWQRLGGFDETYRPAYYEDTDYCMRLWENGLRVVYEPAASVIHYEYASSNSASQATDLHKAHQHVFATRHRQNLKWQYPRVLEARIRNQTEKRLLFIDDRVPHSWLGSGFPRAREILLAILKEGYFVTFYPMSLPNEDWMTVYSDMPRDVEFMMGYGPRLLEAFLRDRAAYYEAIVVSRPHNMRILQLVATANPDWFEHVKIIYDAEALFAGREIALHELRGAPMSKDEADDLMKMEANLALNADSVMAVSESERATFIRNGIERVYVVGHSLRAIPTPRSFEERNGFLFVGAIHEEECPNSDAVVWFIEGILPRIQAELGTAITFTMVGVNNSRRVARLASPSIQIFGHLQDLTSAYDSARVFVAPTRYAAGIPHKVHEAAARGLPVVGTPLLAKQLGWCDGEVFSVAGDSDSFAQKCIELHRNAELWLKLRNAGLERTRVECSKELFEARVKEVLKPGRARYADVGMDR